MVGVDAVGQPAVTLRNQPAMSSHDQRPGTPRFEVDDEMDLLLGSAYPNPTREGCPAPEVLRQLSQRQLPISDPGYEHLARCSPCYREFRGFQQAQRGEGSSAEANWFTRLVEGFRRKRT